ncbi:metallophosphoesterase [Candidatus Pseudothioglobus singularis]|nr:metallophosphoesterase [Candidatus Pseudothioglobus singularis]
MLRILLLITLFFVNFSVYSEGNKYRSILIIGHLYPLYDIFGDGADDKVNYVNLDNLRVLSNQISKFDNLKKVIFLGDTYVDDRESIYKLVDTELLAKINVPVIKIPGNHEIYNIDKFINSGGLKRGSFDIQNFRFLLYSPWELIDGLPQMQVTNDDIAYFKNNLDISKQNIILVTDMVHHNNANISGWRDKIVPILNQYKVEYVVIGDNDQVQHRYSWVEVNDIKYIHQGIAQNYHLPNINTFLEVQIFDDGLIKFIPHNIQFDGLSDVYESSQVGYIKEPELRFFQKIYKLSKKIYYYFFS